MLPTSNTPVAQICNLLCRRFVIGWARACWKALQVENLRYGAARRSRNQSSAELHSTVSPICNRLAVRRDPPADPFEPSAEYNSAIQQITNLRYEKSSRRATTWTDTDRLQVCATGRAGILSASWLLAVLLGFGILAPRGMADDLDDAFRSLTNGRVYLK